MRSHFPRTKWPICSTPWMQNVGKDVKQPELADCQRMRALSAKWNTLLLPTRRLIHGSYSLSLTYSWVFYTLWWAWEEQPLFSHFSLLWRKESFALASQFRVQSVLWGRHCVGEWDLGLSCLTSGNRGRWILFSAPTLFTPDPQPTRGRHPHSGRLLLSHSFCLGSLSGAHTEMCFHGDSQPCLINKVNHCKGESRDLIETLRILLRLGVSLAMRHAAAVFPEPFPLK